MILNGWTYNLPKQRQSTIARLILAGLRSSFAGRRQLHRLFGHRGKRRSSECHGTNQCHAVLYSLLGRLRAGSGATPLLIRAPRVLETSHEQCRMGLKLELLLSRRVKRQPHAKPGAVGTCFKFDFSVMPFGNDAVADHQAKPGP